MQSVTVASGASEMDCTRGCVKMGPNAGLVHLQRNDSVRECKNKSGMYKPINQVSCRGTRRLQLEFYNRLRWRRFRWIVNEGACAALGAYAQGVVFAVNFLVRHGRVVREGAAVALKAETEWLRSDMKVRRVLCVTTLVHVPD